MRKVQKENSGHYHRIHTRQRVVMLKKEYYKWNRLKLNTRKPIRKISLKSILSAK